MAHDVLDVPISTVASESAFSTSGRVLDQFRSSLTPKIVEALICTSDWLRMAKTPINIEEAIDELKIFEKDNIISKLIFCFEIFIIFYYCQLLIFFFILLQSCLNPHPLAL